MREGGYRLTVFTLEQLNQTPDEFLSGVKSIFDLLPQMGPDTTLVVYELPDELPDADQIVFRRIDAIRLH